MAGLSTIADALMKRKEYLFFILIDCEIYKIEFDLCI